MVVKRLYRKPVKRVKRVSRRPRKQLVTKTQLYKAISKNIETKKCSSVYPLTNFNSGINSTADLLTVVPPLGAGFAESTRIGSEIRPVKIVIRGYIIYACDTLDNATNIQAKILLGRLFLFQDKAIKEYGNTASVSLKLLDYGGGSNNFDGTPLNWDESVNHTQFKFFKDMRFKMYKPYGQTDQTTQGSAIQSMNSSLYKSFNITLTQKHLPAKLMYDEYTGTSGSFPVNFAPYLALGYASAQNKTPDGTVTQMKMSYTTTMYYKDA